MELVPPGSTCSIALIAGCIGAGPGSLCGVQVNVDDIDEAHAVLQAGGVAVHRR